MKKVCFFNSISICQGYALSSTNDPYIDVIMGGISNEGLTMEKPYIAAGDRTYIIGTQNGLFPNGGLIPGESEVGLTSIENMKTYKLK